MAVTETALRGNAFYTDRITGLGDLLRVIIANPLDPGTLEATLHSAEDTIRALLEEENHLYRDGLTKSSVRSLLFLLSKNVGHTPVPGEIGNLARLDDRYAHPGDLVKPGEIVEAEAALKKYHRNPTPDSALQVLSEMADVFYNLAQADKNFLPDILNHYLPQNQPVINTLLAVFSNVAMWKFHHRYILHQPKDLTAEANYLQEQLDVYGVNGAEIVAASTQAIGHILGTVKATCHEKLYNQLGPDNYDLVVPYLG